MIHIFRQVRFVGVLGLALTILPSCTTVPVSGPSEQNLYSAAIMDAAVATPAKERVLLPLPDTGTVKVVTWTDASPCTKNAECKTREGPRRMWVTLVGEVQSLCKSWGLQGDALRDRLEQLLGLPPEPKPLKTTFVELEVPRKNLNRPCLVADEGDGSNGSKPKCNSLPPSIKYPWTDEQRFVTMMMGASYYDGGSEPGYPFTRLGYTYDWNDKAGEKGHYGASEFVIDPSTPMELLGIYSTDEYCKNP